ncbi:hypothetical protein [Massilia sp. YIM B02443]|uniref:hypothetical protein n=1 Tax=Massilia sp. YIM B02443 TaxID=3050127 RepID=UPI0025B6670E|nr:hypothetical protein [Massilia sp. YIM B02443]MDN4037642.1 hypothetical protein [Massilia sp. YIM B02443]
MKRSALLLAACLSGCSMFGGPKPVRPAWHGLAFAAAFDANASSALAVDVVLVRDKAVLDTLMAMSAARYFAARADLLRTYPDALSVLGVEITPGQTIRFERKRYEGERAWAALAFANYAAPGEHRVRVALDGAACLVQLNAHDFVVTAAASGAR